MNDFLSTNQEASWAKLLSDLVLFPTNNIADTEKFVRATIDCIQKMDTVSGSVK